MTVKLEIPNASTLPLTLIEYCQISTTDTANPERVTKAKQTLDVLSKAWEVRNHKPMPGQVTGYIQTLYERSQNDGWPSPHDEWSPANLDDLKFGKYLEEMMTDHILLYAVLRKVATWTEPSAGMVIANMPLWNLPRSQPAK